MRIHEYQAKQILADFGVPVPPGKVATDAAEAAEVFDTLPGEAAVVRAQSCGFGSEESAGVGLARSAEQAAALAESMLGSRLGPAALGARPVRKVLVEQHVDAHTTLYLAVVMDPTLAKPVMLAGASPPPDDAGEDRARHPAREVIDPRFGTLDFQWRKITAKLGLDASMQPKVAAAASGLYRAFIECECIDAEIRRLGVTAAGELVALHARMRFDDTALFRHDEIAGLRDPAEFSPAENDLHRARIHYVEFPGHVGCVMFNTCCTLAVFDILDRVGSRAGGAACLDGDESAEKMSYAVGRLLDEDRFSSVLVEVPGDADAAGRIVSAVTLALEKRGRGAPVQVLALCSGAREAVAPLCELEAVSLLGSLDELASSMEGGGWE
jgi:succinyl-CoA synthetase beta subunit